MKKRNLIRNHRNNRNSPFKLSNPKSFKKSFKIQSCNKPTTNKLLRFLRHFSQAKSLTLILSEISSHTNAKGYHFPIVFLHPRYCPTARDMTTSFAKKVLSGEKKLLKLNEILWVKNAPRYKEISSKKLW